MKLVAAIALGGALGALARYVAARQVGEALGLGFPWGTLSVNVLGSFLLGAAAEIAALAAPEGAALRGFLVVGLLGGFTTFSTFSLDTVLLAERGRLDLAAAYAALSAGLAIAGLLAGSRLVRAAVS